MKPELGTKFDPSWEGVPLGMPSQDYILWQRYRPQIADYINHVYFNVRVGKPVPVSNNLPKEIVLMAEMISRRRIDVVLESTICWYLVELKYNAGAEALGQILLYLALWKTDPPDERQVKSIIVSNVENKDLSVACKIYGVELLVV